MPSVGSFAASSRAVAIAKSSGSGSPGPFDSTTPAGSSASTSAALERAGSTRTRKPSARSRRRMLYLTPKSSTAAGGRAGRRLGGAVLGPPVGLDARDQVGEREADHARAPARLLDQ